MYGTAVPVRQPGHTRDTSVLPVPGYAPRTGGWSRHSARALVHVCSPCLPACPWPEHGRSLHVPYPHYNCTCTCACVKCNPTITHRAGRTRHDTCKNGETTDGEVQRRRAFSRKLGGIVQLLRFVCQSLVCPAPPGGAGGGWVGFAGGGLFRVGRGERSAPGLRPLSRPLIRSSRGRAGALVGWDGCEVRLSVCQCVSRLPRFLFTGRVFMDNLQHCTG